MAKPSLIASLAHDLHDKIAEDVTKAAKLTLQLVNGNAALEMYLASAAIVSSSVIMSVMLEARETRRQQLPLTQEAAQKVADQALFGMLLAWHMESPDRHTHNSVDTTFMRAIRAWEAVKGRPFDPSWMDAEIAKIAKESLQVQS